MKIFIVNGTGGSGKTTVEKMIQNIAEQNNKKILITSTIDFVKSIAAKIGWDGSKEPKDRRFLSDLKDAMTRWNDVPYQRIKEQIIDCKKEDYEAIFIDCREPEEIKRFVNEYNATTIIVQRGPVVLLGNHADDNVRNYQYDITIDNSRGLAELEEEARIFVETFLLGE